MASSETAVLQVVILRDGLLVGTEVFIPGSYAIGTAATADLKLEDAGVDPLHAILEFQNGKATIQDAGSAVGIFVNGHRVGSGELRPVDEVRIGPFALKSRILVKQEQVQTKKSEAASKKFAPPKIGPIAPLASSPVRRTGDAGGLHLIATTPGEGPTTVAPVVNGTVLSARRLMTPEESLQPAARSAHLRALTPLPSDDPTAVARADLLAGLAELDNDKTRHAKVEMEQFATMEAQHSRKHEPTAPRAQRPATRPASADRSSVLPRPGVPTFLTSAKGRQRLYLELYWGDRRQQVRSFARGTSPVEGALDDAAPMPLWGFDLPEKFVVAESHKKGFRVFIPPHAKVDLAQGTFFEPAKTAEVSEDRHFITLNNGQALRFTSGGMSLVAYTAPKLRKPFGNPFAGLPWVALSIFLTLLSGFLYLVLYGPQPKEMADFNPQKLPPAAVRLIQPKPKQKEMAQKKLAEIKKHAEEVQAKREKRPVRERAKPKEITPAPPEPTALKALAKLSSMPATRNLLHAMDKMGPGSKNVKNQFKVSGLLGKTPVANAGLGNFGVGTGKGSNRGSELLHGQGAGGIGALGASNFGRKAVGGTVTRAIGRSVATQGSVDREAVAAAINSHVHEVQSCYERALLKEPGIAGKVVLEWTIGGSGQVVTAKTKSSTLRNSDVETCILRSLKGWQFPKVQGGSVIISYPFIFNPIGY